MARLGRRDADLPPPGKLQVTSGLHPFLRTKRGAVVIVLVVLAVIGGIVGGVIGNKKTGPSTNTFKGPVGQMASTTTSAETATGQVTARALARAYPYPVRPGA